MTTPSPAVASPNYKEAFFSFLRVLAVALATAILPYVTAGKSLDWSAIGIAALAALLLTVINFFRPGETRFGPPPNPGAQGGYADVGLLIVLVLVVVLALVLFRGTL